MRYDDDLNTPMIAVAGVIMVVFVFALVVAVQAVFFRMQEDEKIDKYVSKAPMELSALNAGQRELLNSYYWVHKNKGVAGIPVDRAMQLVARECSAGDCLKDGK